MDDPDGRQLLTIVAAAVATAALAAALSWIARGRRARREREAAARGSDARHAEQLAAIETLRSARSRLVDENKLLKSRLGTATVGREAAQAALDRRTSDLERANASLRRASAQLTDRDLQLDELARVAAVIPFLRCAAAEQDRALRLAERDRGALARRVEELVQTRARHESETLQLAVRVESLERDIEQAGAAARQDLEWYRRALAAANALVERSRRATEADGKPAAGRAGEVPASPDRPEGPEAPGPSAVVEIDAAKRLRELQGEVAEQRARDQAMLGALEARARRADQLVRQLQDREALLGAATYERDQALRRLVASEREQRTAAEALAATRTRLELAETLALDERNQRELAERRAATANRERDGAAGLARRLSLEIETLRAELRERDRRFRALARENDAMVMELERRVAELEGELYLGRGGVTGAFDGPPTNGPSADAGDDLTLIWGIGPVLAARLRDHGVTTFRQIAEWSEEDVDRMGPLLGAFPDRIRRDRWIAGAQALVQRAGTA